MYIQFYGAAGTVTGSCFLITTKNERFLVDCGMFQGSKELKENNYKDFPFNPSEIDFVVLTHAHIDHSGLIPKLYKKGFQGLVHTTKATRELCAVVLPDSGHIQEMEVERKNRKFLRMGYSLIEPIYTVKDAETCLQNFKGYHYEEMIEITPNVKVRFQDAGHILGSALIEVYLTEDGISKKIVFSGDIGNINQPIVDDPTVIREADIIVMESTYGNRYHLEAEDRLEILTRVVKNTMKKGGNLIIPAFAVERTQDLIYHLMELKDKGVLPELNIYIDSPMAVEATEVFTRNPQFFDEEALAIFQKKGGQNLFTGEGIHYVRTAEESMQLNKIKSGAVIISASGMAEAGRIKHHLKHNLWRPECTVLFVGYQAEGTLGRRILDGEKKVKIHGEEVAVKADIVRIDGFSAHADQKGLVEWLKGFQKTPDKVFLVHGEEDALNTLQRVILSETGIRAEIPHYGARYDIASDTMANEDTNIFKAIPATTSQELLHAFNTIKRRIEELAKMPEKDTRLLQRLLAQVHEVEREINKAV
ncbi:MBL fold metallo-hydrolase [Thermanaerosceptrum fracticalcis]|uniref:MBL fold metallo-hydrolase n=1 Tax=Thermanaerosceptrum fracticalcis TaxID=1712410 RepID=A0A7G6E161_THEFR|nr:MBL fold metallo-hydrolase [Thermanaerosceptrum fracticalcis]QNB45815.1 MBL fold metallo-hydrolase [Thermanaerosceptrum fracticalcis]